MRVDRMGLGLVLLLAGCATGPQTAAPPTAPASAAAVPDIAAIYLAAIRDAAAPTAKAVDNDLMALTPDNPDLVRDGSGPGARIKVVTLVSQANYDKFYATPPTESTAPDFWGVIWVTPAPQLQRFCARIPGDDAARLMRIKQWLGLSPSGSYARVVELWISPEALARPCPDNEVTDKACALDTGDPKQPKTDPHYAAWFNGWYRVSYREGGYPWTRLGYTYDWAPATDTLNPRRPFGGSEYVLRPKAKYTVAGSASIADYCAPKVAAATP